MSAMKMAVEIYNRHVFDALAVTTKLRGAATSLHGEMFS